MRLFRSILFNVVFYVNLVVFLVVGSPLMFGPRRWAMFGLKLWAITSQWWLEVIVGIDVDVRGRANVPDGAVIVAGKHQSLFETFALIPLFNDPAMVLKRELLFIPLFGWFAAKFRMIPVDRGAGASALRGMLLHARRAAAGGREILIFPEGTRRPPGAPPAYKPGAAAIYGALGLPCVPMAINSGLFWPRRKILKTPGTIVVEFLPPIPPGLRRADFSRALEGAIEQATARLLAEAEKKLPHRVA
jgi:1-acyl-sn-glycerol-3-phosphate acyltransferase